MKLRIFLILSVFIYGCSSTPSTSNHNRYADTYPSLNTSDQVLILPIRNHFKDFSKGEEVVIFSIAENFHNKGYEVKVLNKDNYRQLWAKSVNSVGGIYSPRTGQLREEKYMRAMKVLIHTLSENVTFSYVLSPSFTLKRAELASKKAKWDGVKRSQPTKGSAGYSYNWSGDTKGLSLELNIYNSSGNWGANTFGGLQLPFIANVSRSNPRNEVREDLFEDSEEIKEGVEVAIRALITK